MHVVLTPYRVHAGRMTDFVNLFDSISDALLNEQPGYQGGLVLQKPGSDDEMLTLHYYASEAHANAGPQTDTVRSILQQIASMVDVEQAMKNREVYETVYQIGD